MKNQTFSYYADVEYRETKESTLVLEPNMVYSIYEMGGNAANDGYSFIKIIHGTNVIYSTYGTGSGNIELNIITGEEPQEIKIQLINESWGSRTLGGYVVYSYGPNNTEE